MLYEWKKGDATQAYAVPGYIYLVLVLGGMASFSNCLSYMGACSRSVCLLSASTSMVLCVLLLEGALALVLFYKPSLVDSKVCPVDDAACLERIDNLFKDPSAHAGLAILHVIFYARSHTCVCMQALCTTSISKPIARIRRQFRECANSGRHALRLSLYVLLTVAIFVAQSCAWPLRRAGGSSCVRNASACVAGPVAVAAQHQTPL